MRACPAAGDLVPRRADGLIAEVIEDHIREHMIAPAAATDDSRTMAAEELVEIVHADLT